jgi:ATP-dependent Clp protease ATP-binding subunit ClpX
MMEKVMLDVMYDLPSRGDVRSVILTEEAITGERPPTLKRRTGDRAAA